MKLSAKIWKELGALSSHVEMLDHDHGTARYKASATTPDIAACDAVLAAHDPNAPDPDEVAAEALQQADEDAKQYAKAAPVIQYLATHTPAECEAWVEANVTNLATAKDLLCKFAIALCVLARREFR